MAKRPMLLLAGITAGVLTSSFMAPVSSAFAAGPDCIDVRSMRTTRAIDDNTIVVTMRGSEYRKIALVSRCVGLKIQNGFSYATTISRLCPGDIISVLGGGGDRCGIATITPLNAADAKALLAGR